MCDIPPETYKSALEYIKKEIKPDIIIWMGDNSAHTVWDETENEIIESSVKVTEILKDYFADTTVTVLPSLGNHDVFPVNVMDFSKPNSNRAINFIADHWTEWIGEEAVKVFKQYGYYSTPLVLKNGKEFKNTKIISLNTEACLYWNWYLFDSRADPGNHIAWLEKELSDLEKVNG